jgi:hypothetical protein
MTMLRRLAPAILVLAAIVAAAPVGAQVLVAPTVVTISERQPFGMFIVANQSDETQEVTIAFRFGYPVSDSVGTLAMVYGDTLPEAARSLQPWVRAFPRQFTLLPGQQQTVRIIGRPDGELPDGTYWTRIVTTSTPQPPMADVRNMEVTARVVFRLEQVTTLLHRHGAALTAVDIAPATLVNDGTARAILVPLRLSGNSPFLGKLHMTLKDSTGAIVADDFEFFAMYVDMTKRLALPDVVLKPGDYSVEVTLTSERDDVPAGTLLSMQPVRQTFPLRVP